MTYPRPQLRLLFLLAGILLVGLGVREWRAGFPELAERLERFDREDAPPPIPPQPRPRAPARWTAAAKPETPTPAPVAWPRRARVAAVEPEPVTDPRPLDLNHASVEEIARLPGVGPSLARRIIEERERRGRFDSPEGLRSVLGLGPRKLAALRELVTVGD
jgi:competence ComEA-like helix-hairpin-helix protein